MSEWQPIETAPKDGTEILGWRDDCGTLVVRWDTPINFLTERELEGLAEESANSEGWFYADFVAGGRLDGEREVPTHWTPLPPGRKSGVSGTGVSVRVDYGGHRHIK